MRYSQFFDRLFGSFVELREKVDGIPEAVKVLDDITGKFCFSSKNTFLKDLLKHFVCPEKRILYCTKHWE